MITSFLGICFADQKSISPAILESPRKYFPRILKTLPQVPVIPRSSLSHRLFRDNENTISSWKQGPVRRDITRNIPFVGCQASARCYTTPARWQINTAITPRIQILQARRGGTPKQPKRSLELVITVRQTVLDLWLS